MDTFKFIEIINIGRGDYIRNSGWEPTDLYLGPSAYAALQALRSEFSTFHDATCTKEMYMGMEVHRIEEDEIRIGTTSRVFVNEPGIPESTTGH